MPLLAALIIILFNLMSNMTASQSFSKFSDNHQPENSKHKNVTEIRDFWGDTVLCFVAHIKMVFSHVSFKYK